MPALRGAPSSHMLRGSPSITGLGPFLSPLRLASQPGGLLWGLTPEEITFLVRPVCRARRLGVLW